jgi:hypothetical protein
VASRGQGEGEQAEGEVIMLGLPEMVETALTWACVIGAALFAVIPVVAIIYGAARNSRRIKRLPPPKRGFEVLPPTDINESRLDEPSM